MCHDENENTGKISNEKSLPNVILKNENTENKNNISNLENSNKVIDKKMNTLSKLNIITTTQNNILSNSSKSNSDINIDNNNLNNVYETYDINYSDFDKSGSFISNKKENSQFINNSEEDILDKYIFSNNKFYKMDYGNVIRFDLKDVTDQQKAVLIYIYIYIYSVSF